MLLKLVVKLVWILNKIFCFGFLGLYSSVDCVMKVCNCYKIINYSVVFFYRMMIN